MTTSPRTVLVVDDNPWNRELITRRLKRSGYNVVEAGDGREAVSLVQGSPVDLIILDIMMPGMSGIEVLKTLRQDFSAAELPIIMATAKNQSDDVVEALEMGANDYVTKPLDFPVVLARVQALLRTKEAAEASARPAAARPEDDDPDAMETRPRTGLVLSRKFKLLEKMGAGNFGEVYRAVHLALQQPVAVKVLLSTAMSSPDAVERFQQEGASTFRLKHPNAVSVLDFGVTPGGIAFLVMELLEGRGLDVEMKERGRMSADRCLEILLPVLDVLSEAHAIGIIHRDIKPPNVFLHRTQRREIVKVLDFGIAKLVGDSVAQRNLTVEGGVLGTPAFMAPERLQDRDYDGRSDVYSVGVMTYKMLAGRGPFISHSNEAMAIALQHLTAEPEPLERLRPDLPRPFTDAVMATLVKDPDERPTVAELIQLLDRASAAAELKRPAERPLTTAPAAPRREIREPKPVEPPAQPPLPPPEADSPFAFGDLLGFDAPPPPSPQPAPPTTVVHTAEPPTQYLTEPTGRSLAELDADDVASEWLSNDSGRPKT